MIKKIFITGTDTGIGKTIVSGILLKKANELGYKTAGYKPISSGIKKRKMISSVMQKKKKKNINLSIKML